MLIGATTVSLIGNVAHATLSYIPPIVVQIGAAAVPPIALLAAVHGTALAVRAGASGRVYRWALSATAAIGAGAFAVSFLALRDLMLAIGYNPATAWAFPAIIDTAVAVSTVMLVALGDKPARRSRAPWMHARTTLGRKLRSFSGCRSTRRRMQKSTSSRLHRPIRGHRRHDIRRHKMLHRYIPTATQTVQSAPSPVTQPTADLASELIASGTTTQSVDTVIAVLSTYRDGASINAAAKASGINYRTAQRIVEGATEHRQLMVVG